MILCQLESQHTPPFQQRPLLLQHLLQNLLQKQRLVEQIQQALNNTTLHVAHGQLQHEDHTTKQLHLQPQMPHLMMNIMTTIITKNMIHILQMTYWIQNGKVIQ